MNVREELAAAGVRVRPKSESYLMTVIGWLLRLLGVRVFATRFWTTLGPRTIWAPSSVDLSSIDAYALIIRHELVHARQARRWPVWFQVSYMLLPLPFGLAWFRCVLVRRERDWAG